jgi:hypothetical protein
MPQDSLRIDDQPGTQAGQRILRLHGALVMTTMFEFPGHGAGRPVSYADY